MPWPTLGKKTNLGGRRRRPSIISLGGTPSRRPAEDHREKTPAPGNQGIVARISTSQRCARAPNCCRLNGDERGSEQLGKIFVKMSTRIVSLPLARTTIQGRRPLPRE